MSCWLNPLSTCRDHRLALICHHSRSASFDAEWFYPSHSQPQPHRPANSCCDHASSFPGVNHCIDILALVSSNPAFLAIYDCQKRQGLPYTCQWSATAPSNWAISWQSQSYRCHAVSSPCLAPVRRVEFEWCLLEIGTRVGLSRSPNPTNIRIAPRFAMSYLSRLPRIVLVFTLWRLQRTVS